MAVTNNVTRLLIIAGSDSSGAAGLVRDLQVLADHNARGLCAITAVTAQTAGKVAAMHHVPGEVIARQIECALQEGVQAIKIGMLGTAESVRAVASALAQTSLPIVIDPVLRSTSGTELLDAPGRALLHSLLLPLASVATPNLPEALLLLDRCGGTPAFLARQLADKAACPVLVKGGHGTGPLATDWLCQAGLVTAIETPRLQASMRGSGCALSTAIAVQLARGLSLRRACEVAKGYVAGLLQDLR